MNCQAAAVGQLLPVFRVGASRSRDREPASHKQRKSFPRSALALPLHIRRRFHLPRPRHLDHYRRVARASGASTHTEGNDARGDERSEKDAWHEHASDIASESVAMWRCFESGKDSRKILQYKFGKGHHFLSGLLNLK